MPKFIIRALHETGATRTMEVTAIDMKDATTSFFITTTKQGLDFNGWEALDIDKKEPE